MSFPSQCQRGDVFIPVQSRKKCKQFSLMQERYNAVVVKSILNMFFIEYR